MAKLSFYLDIKPHPQERIRISFRRGNARAYYPEKTVEFQEAVRQMVQEYMAEYGIEEFNRDTALEIEMTFYLPKPKSVKRDYPTVRPDLSNYIKSLEDGIQRKTKTADPALLEDDSAIIRIVAEKLYVDSKHAEPGILVTIGEYNG